MTPAAASTALYLSVTCVAIPLGGALYVGFLAGHATDIAQSWADGVEQLTAWRDGVRDNAAPVALAALLWLLTVLLPAKGTHRPEVTQ